MGLGAFSAALGACCVAPWAVSILGVAGAVALARLAFLQPYVLGGTAGLLGLAFWLAYRPQPKCADGTCEVSSQRRLRRVLWLATAFAALLAAAGYAPHFLA
jgi:MerT mercuric transport protein